MYSLNETVVHTPSTIESFADTILSSTVALDAALSDAKSRVDALVVERDSLQIEKTTLEAERSTLALQLQQARFREGQFNRWVQRQIAEISRCHRGRSHAYVTRLIKRLRRELAMVPASAQ